MMKLNRKNFVVISLGLLFFVIVLDFYKFQILNTVIKKLNDKIKNEKSIRSNDQYKNEIEKIVSKWCDPQKVSLNYVCLNRVSEMDQIANKYIKHECSNEDKIVFHTFWKFDSNNSLYLRVLKLNLMSFLTTQNLKCSKLILWTLNSFMIKSKIIAVFDYYLRSRVLEMRQFDLKELCLEARDRNGHFAKSSVCILSKKQDNLYLYNMIGFSDLVRFFVLDIYGGIFINL